MNSVFLNYDTSYFDLAKNSTVYGNNRLVKSLGGSLVDSSLIATEDEFNTSISTGIQSLLIGEKHNYTPNFESIKIGYYLGGGGYYNDFFCDIYPTTTLHQGLKFTRNISKYNNSDLWVNSFGVLNYRDRSVVSLGANAVPGNIPIFGDATTGAIEDGLDYSTGTLVLTLYSENSSISDKFLDISFDYQKVGKSVVLSLRKVMFSGADKGSPIGFDSRTSSGLLPPFLTPKNEVSANIMIYINGSIVNQSGLLRLGGDIYGGLSNVGIFKSPDGNATFTSSVGADGWSGATISYLTL